MTAASTFTATQRNQIETLRRDLVQRTHRPITTQYGVTDDGQHWAALGIETLPDGAAGEPGVVVSILTGAGIPGDAAVMASDSSSIAHGVEFPEAIKAARFAAMRAYRVMASKRPIQ
ncbi:hypothetical protein QTH90_06305 [Variovorax sp. J2P1-59]|uniref:hypothetical protein n=1 Tax=Variovorax flavidus TaxID=3053501 RepID=UPI002578F401|nr:hypothetical protein [Variovorax sp. J2P1-59]MDM0073986.1 hypothetical protein [Variovorax sp. J2P1-59]